VRSQTENRRGTDGDGQSRAGDPRASPALAASRLFYQRLGLSTELVASRIASLVCQQHDANIAITIWAVNPAPAAHSNTKSVVGPTRLAQGH
jgi:hypothetical protein